MKGNETGAEALQQVLEREKTARHGQGAEEDRMVERQDLDTRLRERVTRLLRKV